MKTIITGTILVLALVLPTFVSAAFPAFPMAFWGTITIDGSPAPVGTVVRAYYGSTLAGAVTLQENGIYGYVHPVKQKILVGEGDGTITFKFQSSSINGGNETAGVSAQTYSGFSAGTTIEKNLIFALPASGGSGGGGSTGGGSSGGGGGG